MCKTILVKYLEVSIMPLYLSYNSNDMATDRNGNEIGEGGWNVDFFVFEFPEFSQVRASISKSETTESVYVTYFNDENSKSITVRFSNHENNAVRFGDQLNGFYAKKQEILFHLGLAKRTFVPNTYLSIEKQAVAKKNIGNYEFSELTIAEMYSLGEGADLSKFKGKLAKDSNYLILGDKVEKHEEKSRDFLGQIVTRGTYIYN